MKKADKVPPKLIAAIDLLRRDLYKKTKVTISTGEFITNALHFYLKHLYSVSTGKQLYTTMLQAHIQSMGVWANGVNEMERRKIILTFARFLKDKHGEKMDIRNYLRRIFPDINTIDDIIKDLK